ncbi:hypothetical protein JCM8547_001366 [Rhodosporidiobolus lusitaniae]
MEIRLKNASTPWTCRVFLRFELNEDGTPVETVREVAFGPPTTKPEDVEGTLRRAQLAILNPSVKDHKVFLGMSDKDVIKYKDGTAMVSGSTKQHSFSENLVCLDITGPTVTDLAFLDLPGLIANSDIPGDVELIENMVIKRIKGNCLTLLTVSMRDDYQNQKAGVLAKEADPQGRRAIGVLTKADLVQSGEHASWIDMLEGRKYPLSLGYFVVKQLSPKQLKKNLSFDEARKLGRLLQGRDAVVHPCGQGSSRYRPVDPFLERALGQTDLTQSLTSVLEQIKALPPAPSADPSSELHTRIGRRTQDLQALNHYDDRFREVLKSTRPVFTPFLAKEKDKIEAGARAFQLEPRRSPDPHYVLRMALDDVRRHIDKHKGREVPLSTPYGAKVDLMLLANTAWPEIALDALERLRRPVTQAVDGIVKTYFGASCGTELRSKTSMAISDILKELFKGAHARLDDTLELEKTPFTLNEAYFAITWEGALNDFKEARQDRLASASPEALANIVGELAKVGITT